MNNIKSAVKSLIYTEKGTTQEAQGKYLFWVDKNASKPQIRNAVEKLYKVSVVSVNTMVVPGKAKRVRQQLGYKPDWKKAVITVKEGQKIEVK